jgi:hypothetical protein
VESSVDSTTGLELRNWTLTWLTSDAIYLISC